ncbi:MAG: prepilin-type N-terminal cleavage/methylation domain-containing protein, partial [Proteobacteria bacterium]|nr:prepilin-type N-terminal cleavage/methylation domain-containing protein [Pseudomonadota bacterium]
MDPSLSPRKDGRRGNSAAGFTLLEVLVAVTLLGLLSVGLFDMVRVGVLGWRHVDERGAEAEDAAAVQDVLRRMIATARPAVATGGGGTGLAFR